MSGVQSEVMEKRWLVVSGVAATAAVVVGLSAAATTYPDTAPPQPASKPSKSAASKARPLGVPTSRPASAVGTADYWTRERMKEAQPMEKTVPSSSATPPAPGGNAAPEVVTPRAAPRKTAAQRKGSQSAPTTGPVRHSTTGNPADYWTKDRMDDAQPKGNTVPTDNPGDTQDASDPPLIVVSPPLP